MNQIPKSPIPPVADNQVSHTVALADGVPDNFDIPNDDEEQKSVFDNTTAPIQSQADIDTQITRSSIELEKKGVSRETATVLSAMLCGYTIHEACNLANMTATDFYVTIMGNPKANEAVKGVIKSIGLQLLFDTNEIMNRIRGAPVVSAGDMEIIKFSQFVIRNTLPEWFGTKAVNAKNAKAAKAIEEESMMGSAETTDTDTPIVMQPPENSEIDAIIEKMGSGIEVRMPKPEEQKTDA